MESGVLTLAVAGMSESQWVLPWQRHMVAGYRLKEGRPWFSFPA